MYSENYMNWIAEEKERCEKLKIPFVPLTSTQHRFAEWCFQNHRRLQSFGNLERVFEGCSKFVKHSPKFKIPLMDGTTNY